MERSERARALHKALQLEAQENASFRLARKNILVFSACVLTLELVCRAAGAIVSTPPLWFWLVVMAEQLCLILAVIAAYGGHIAAASALLFAVGCGSAACMPPRLCIVAPDSGEILFFALYAVYVAAVFALAAALCVDRRFRAFGSRARELLLELSL